MAEPWEDGMYPLVGLPIVEGDRFQVLGAAAGPAGVSAVELDDGSVWEVDHADPTVPVSFEVDALDPAGSALLIAAFGGDGALFLRDQAAQVARDVGDGEDLGRLRPEPWEFAPRARSGPNVAGLEAGQLVVLTDLGADRQTHPLARVAATVELVNNSGRVLGGDLLRPLVPGVLDRAEVLTDDIDDDELALLDPDTAARLATACMRAGKVAQRADSPLFGLARRIDDAVDHDGRQGSARMPGSRQNAVRPFRRDQVQLQVAAMAMPEAAFDEAFEDAEASGGGGAFQQVERVTPTLVRVTVARADESRWVRVLNGDGLVLLAQAPLRPDGLLQVAELVVPPDVGHDLHVQVVDHDDLDVLAGRPADLIRAAVQAGRDAARTTRSRDVPAARIRWERCAVLWEQAGDEQRARQAREMFATSASNMWGSRPFLADEVAEQLDMSS